MVGRMTRILNHGFSLQARGKMSKKKKVNKDIRQKHRKKKVNIGKTWN
jgi:hypothetical protein